jgi:hypothetical protein
MLYRPLLGRGKGGSNIPTTATARKGQTPRREIRQNHVIILRLLRLAQHRTIPANAQPVKIFINLSLKMIATPRRIQIFDS